MYARKVLQSCIAYTLMQLVCRVAQKIYLCSTGIDIAPTTQRANLSISDYASFYCRATGQNTFWIIDELTYSSGNTTENGYRLSEVILEVLEGGSIVHNMYLEILTTVENNETSVQCGAFFDTFQSSPPVQLIVQGKYICCVFNSLRC